MTDEATHTGDQPIRVCLLIRQLNLGGAQRQLLSLAKGLDQQRFQIAVVTFYPGGIFCNELMQYGNVDLYCLHKQGRWETICFYLRALRLLRQLRPDVIYAFLGGANLLASVCRPWIGRSKVVWGVRGSGLEWQRYAWPERFTARLETAMSNLPDAIICNSQAGLAAAALRGMKRKKLLCIANGIDIDEFRPSAIGVKVRERWRLKPGEVVLGLVARADPMKDHSTCFEAVRILRERGIPARLQLLGYVTHDEEKQLRGLAETCAVAEWCSWGGVSEEMPEVYSAFDLLISSSAYGEGFPNVVAEAMACGTPCVVTDVGDAAQVVGTLGEVVPPRDPLALADGIQNLLERLASNRQLQHAVRARIIEHFSTEVMVLRTAALLVRVSSETSQGV